MASGTFIALMVPTHTTGLAAVALALTAVILLPATIIVVVHRSGMTAKISKKPSNSFYAR